MPQFGIVVRPRCGELDLGRHLSNSSGGQRRLSGREAISSQAPDGRDRFEAHIGANVIQELDNSWNLLARYAPGLGMDQQLAELRSGVTSYYQQDGLGSVSSLSNSAATLANTYIYDSFGNLAASTGTLINPFQYAGRDFDSEDGPNWVQRRNKFLSLRRQLARRQCGSTRTRQMHFHRLSRNALVLASAAWT